MRLKPVSVQIQQFHAFCYVKLKQVFTTILEHGFATEPHATPNCLPLDSLQ